MGRGKIVVISGPSGAGKTTILKRLIDRCRLPLALSVSATTRPPRPGERHGEDYWFLSPEEFDQRRKAGEFLECFEVFGRGYWYGTLAATVASSLEAGNWVVLEIDVQGGQRVLEQFPDAVSIFVRPQSLQELENRLRGRGTENEAIIQRRLEVARHEWSCRDRYAYDVVNDQVDKTVNKLCQILEREAAQQEQSL